MGSTVRFSSNFSIPTNEDVQQMVNKAIIVKNKIKEMEKNGKRKISFLG
jgi:hypothetical protein